MDDVGAGNQNTDHFTDGNDQFVVDGEQARIGGLVGLVGFGTLVFLAREKVDMPAPGDARAARFTVELRDLVWDWLYAPIYRSIEFAAVRLNRLQFLTIRQYLSLVFLALVILLLVLALWT